MAENQTLSEQIQEICHFVNLAVKEVLTADTAYQNYARAFESLLRQHISRIDADKQAAMQEMIRVIFIVYDDMVEAPENESIQAEKLAHYIEKLLSNLQNDPTYLQRWSMESCIDALLLSSEDLKLSSNNAESLEDYVENSMRELDALLNDENQKLELNTAFPMQEDEEDELEQDMQRILNVSLDELQIDKIPMPNLASESIDTETTTHADDSEASPRLSRRSFDSLRSISSQDEMSSGETVKIIFTEKFNRMMSAFQNQSFDHIPDQMERMHLEQSVDKIAKNLFSAYNTCFREGITEEHLNEFVQISQSLLHNWTYWTEPNNTPLSDQAFAKLNMNLLKLTDETRQMLAASPVSPKQIKNL